MATKLRSRAIKFQNRTIRYRVHQILQDPSGARINLRPDLNGKQRRGEGLKRGRKPVRRTVVLQTADSILLRTLKVGELYTLKIEKAERR